MQNYTKLTLPTSNHFRYRIAGMEVVSNRAANLPYEGFADLKVDVEFLGTFASTSHDYAPPNWCEVPWLLSPEIRLHTGGNRAVVLGDTLDQESCAIAIRQLVPFASALQGEVMLHASAVTINNQIVCFIAESGSGKSTLAGALKNIGYPFICDDLLPCRLRNGLMMVPHVNENCVSFLKISMVCFLSRNASLSSPKLKIITSKESLKLLLRNGFGEMKNEAIWKLQFETYGSLATTVKTCRLTIPDNLSLVDKAAGEFAALFETRHKADH